MAAVAQASSTLSNPTAGRNPRVADAGVGFYARKFDIPEEEKPYLPFAINIFEEMMTDPPQLTCSLSLTLFEDPVMDLAGHTYDRKNIQQHFDQQQQKEVPFTTPLTNETLEARTLIPNRAKKSELEEYKTAQASKCFELAKQCLQCKCGESALLLIDRVKQLNPKLQGLATIEDQARETFISIQKKKEIYIRRAEKAMQEEKPQEALQLLRYFMKPIEYLYTPSQEPSWVIPESTYVGIRSNYLVTCRGKQSFCYTLWDLKTKTQIATYDAKDFVVAGNVQMPLKNAIVLFSQAIDCTLIMLTDGRTKFFDYRAPLKSSYYDGECRESFKGLNAISIFGWETEGFIIQKTFVREQYVADRDGWGHPKNYGSWKKQGSEYYTATLIYPDGTEKYIGDSSHFFKQHPSDPTKYELVKNEEFFLKTYFPQGTKSGSGTLSSEISPPACSPPIQWRPETKDSNLQIDRSFPTDIHQPEDVKFYTLLLQAAVAQGDFDAYLYALKHLVIHHHKADTWKLLEEIVVRQADKTQPFKERLLREIESAVALKEDFWVSRFYLFLGLLESAVMIKFTTYKKGLKSYPADAVLKTAVRHVKLLPLEALGSSGAPGVDLESYQRLQQQVLEQQKQIEKLQELVQSLLLADPKK